MNSDIAQGNWKQLSGKIKQKWGKLTDDDLMRAKGDKEYLVGKLHEQYGLAKDKAQDELQTLGYSEDDQDVDLRSSDRSAAGRMDLAGNANSGSGVEQTRDGYGNKQGSNSGTGSTSNRNDKLNAGSNQQDAGRSGQDMDDSQESGSSSFRQGSGSGAGHTLEAAGSSQDSPSKSGGTGSNKPGSKSGQQGSSGSDKSSQQKGNRNNPGGSGSSRT
jgi:uncharacterized protein YjbJ (UPF0337 family)